MVDAVCRRTRKDRQKHPRLFFVSETEQKMYANLAMAKITWLNPDVHVSRDTLFTAIEQVEMLAEWLEANMLAVRYRR